jgi:hypothetical protein
MSVRNCEGKSQAAGGLGRLVLMSGYDPLTDISDLAALAMVVRSRLPFGRSLRHLKASLLLPQRSANRENRMRVRFLFSTAVLMATSASAQPQQLQRGPIPAWATPSEPLAVPEGVSGPVFVRRQDLKVHYTPRGQDQYLGYRFKILQPAALELGNLSIAWNPKPVCNGRRAVPR